VSQKSTKNWCDSGHSDARDAEKESHTIHTENSITDGAQTTMQIADRKTNCSLTFARRRGKTTSKANSTYISAVAEQSEFVRTRTRKHPHSGVAAQLSINPGLTEVNAAGITR